MKVWEVWSCGLVEELFPVCLITSLHTDPARLQIYHRRFLYHCCGGKGIRFSEYAACTSEMLGEGVWKNNHLHYGKTVLVADTFLSLSVLGERAGECVCVGGLERVCVRVCVCVFLGL